MALKAMKIKLDIFLCFSTIVSLINCELVINVRINQQNEKNLDLDENGLSVQNFASGTDESESIGFLRCFLLYFIKITSLSILLDYHISDSSDYTY